MALCIDNKQSSIAKVVAALSFFLTPNIIIAEEKRYEIAVFLEYDAVDIANSARLRSGIRAVCIRYVGIVDRKPLIEVLPC